MVLPLPMLITPSHPTLSNNGTLVSISMGQNFLSPKPQEIEGHVPVPRILREMFSVSRFNDREFQTVCWHKAISCRCKNGVVKVRLVLSDPKMDTESGVPQIKERKRFSLRYYTRDDNTRMTSEADRSHGNIQKSQKSLHHSCRPLLEYRMCLILTLDVQHGV